MRGSSILTKSLPILHKLVNQQPNLTMRALWTVPDSKAGQGYTTTLTSDRPKPQSGPNEALVRIHATSLNPSDVSAAIANRFNAKLPNTCGRDWAGVIEEAADQKLVGKAVFGGSGQGRGNTSPGTWAEYMAVPVDQLVFKPDNLPMLQAGAVGTAYQVSLDALLRAHVRRGQDVILVLGATGSSGRAAVDIATTWGCKVLRATRHDDADVNLVKDPSLSAVKKLTNGKGVDVIIDTVGSNDYFTASIEILAIGGRFSYFSAGKGSSPDLTVPGRAFYTKNLTLSGINTYVPDEQVQNDMRELAELFAAGMPVRDAASLIQIKPDQAVGHFEDVIKFGGKKYVIDWS